MDAHPVRRLVYQLRTEGGGPAREAIAIGLGIFIGCSPFYGLHLVLCWALGSLFRLNRLKLYLAANVSNPFMAPLLVFVELQAGAWIRRGQLHSITVESVRHLDAWGFGADLLVGSAVVGGVLGVATAVVTYLATRGAESDPFFDSLVRSASDRYVTTSITAWEFARGKLKGDPLYRTLLTSGLLPTRGTIVDVGCGSGLMLALLAEAAAKWKAGSWPRDLPAPPHDARLIGVEMRTRAATVAHRALGGAATIIEGDARTYSPPGCAGVLFFDVLHMMPREDQQQLLGAMTTALDAAGVVLVREADAQGGWRFLAVNAGNRTKAVLFGHWRQTFHYRTAAEWTSCFERLGFDVAQHDAARGTPFANVLFVLRDRRHGSGCISRS